MKRPGRFPAVVRAAGFGQSPGVVDSMVVRSPQLAARFLLALAAACLPTARSFADEPAAASGGVDAAAEAAVAAWRAGDEAALAALAGRDEPDPWLVADRLLSEGEEDAAAAFGRAARRADVDSLPAYVASQPGASEDPGVREGLEEARAALAAGRHDDALAAVARALPRAVGVPRVLLLHLRGTVLEHARRLEESHAAFVVAAREAEPIGWLRRATSCWMAAGNAAYHRSDWAPARTAWERARRLAEARGDRRSLARALVNLGVIHDVVLRDYGAARDHYRRSLAIHEEVGDRDAVATTLQNVAILDAFDGRPDLAIEGTERALAIRRATGDRAQEATLLGNLGRWLMDSGERERAVATLREGLRIAEEVGDLRATSEVLRKVARVHEEAGEYEAAAAAWDRVRRAAEELGDRHQAAVATGSAGLMHRVRGDYAAALRLLETALERFEALGDDAEVAHSHHNLGNVHFLLGDPDRALGHLERALEAHRRHGNEPEAAGTLVALGTVDQALGEDERALERYREAAALLGERSPVVRAGLRLNEAILRRKRGENEASLALTKEVLASLGDAEQRPGAAKALQNLALVHAALGQLGDAERAARESVRLAEGAGARDVLVGSLDALARVQREGGDARAVVATCRRAARELSALGRSLAEEQGALARQPFAGVLALGADAAADLGALEDAFFFLESGRASTLLESLGGRPALDAVAIPPSLRDAETRARAAEASALVRYRRAEDRADRREARRMRREVERSREEVLRVVEWIQREAKAGASLVVVGADPLARVQEALAPAETLVVYGLSDARALAAVVRREGIRVVRLGDSRTIGDACRALVASDRAVDPEPAAAALRAMVVEPLGLAAGSGRVWVSPDGALADVPFSLLLPDREVAFVPSGTVLRLLASSRAPRGSEVLALGDPEYGPRTDPTTAAVLRGRGSLAPLPGGREEARAVGDVVLVGPDANETRFREEVARVGRWRSVHLACHGFAHSERASLAALALAPSAKDDGLLTAVDVFRIEVPADLVVLSACETGRGRFVRGEGILGLTRAFLFAGSPRVICSLWKVDDEATRALMVRFYALWNPKDGSAGLGTAAALRAAQAHVRAEARWRHPCYWAAWVLWGLAD